MNINHSKSEDFQSVWQFDLEDKSWSKNVLVNPNPLGAPRGHSSILNNNKLYIFGGVILFKKFQNALFSIDLKTFKVENINYNKENNSTIPNPTAFHSAALVDQDKFLIQGGLDQHYNAINDCYVYYFKEEKFDKIIIPLIPKIFGHKMVFSSEKNSMFLVGGMDSFKYVGNENLIYSLEKEGDNLFDEKVFEFEPMKNIFEICVKVDDINKKIKDKNGDMKEIPTKRKRWKNVIYIPPSK